jgi:hypothetical protein
LLFVTPTIKFNNVIGIASIACTYLFPTAVAILGTSCIDTFKHVTLFPRLLAESVQREACAARYAPTLDNWNSELRREAITGRVKDGERYTDYYEAEAVFIRMLQYSYDVQANC